MIKNIPHTYWQSASNVVGPSSADQFSEIGQQDTRQALEMFILQNSNKNTSLLDAGCNTAVEGYRLMSAGYSGRYYGVDSNPKALHFALENLVGTQSSFILADLSSIPFPDRSFDIVLNKDVIEHAQSYEPILRELTRLTKRYLILSFFIKLNDYEDRIDLQPGGYYHNSYEQKRFMGFMSGCGMKTPHIIFENTSDQVLVFEKIN